MRNRLVAVPLTVLALATSLAACGSDSSSDVASGGSAASGKAPDGLSSKDTATFCIDPEYAPLEYYKNGSSGDIVGFDADASRAIAAKWGVKAKFEVTAFDGLMPALQSRRCDVLLSGLYINAKRTEVADATPIMVAGPAVVTTPARASTIKKPEDLCGLRVVTQAASANSGIVKDQASACGKEGKGALTSTEYPKVAETVLAVLNGKADALVETNIAAAYMASQNKGRLVVAEGVFPPDTKFGVFTRKGDKLSAAVATAVKELRADGTLAKIAKTYELNPNVVEVG